MKIIDARSGEVMTLGKTVSYGDGEKIKLVRIDEHLLSPRALVEITYRDPSCVGGGFITTQQWVPLAVQIGQFERVAFISS